MSKEVVQLGADVSELLKAFKDVKTQFASVTKTLSAPIAIKIDTKSLDALAKSIGKQFGAVGKDISTAINKGNKDIVKGIGDVRKAISTIGLDTNKVADKIVKDLGSVGKKATAAAKKAGTSMGQAVAAGASAGVAPLGSKLENQLEAVFDRINRRIANLNKRKGSNFAVAQMREQLRKIAAEADPGGNMGILGKGGQIPPGLYEALGVKNFAGKKGPVVGLDTATITRINGILSDTEKQVSATNVNSREFSAATKKSIERHERNEARKAALVDRVHAQAIAMLERERIATEKAHVVANKMVSGEKAAAKAAVEKKHLADVQDFVNHQRRIFKARLAADEQEARNKKKAVDLTNRINDSYQQALDRARALLRAQPARLSTRLGGAEAFASIGYTPESLVRTRRNGTSFVSADRAQEVRNSTRGLLERLEKAPRNGAFTKDDTARANQMLTTHKGISASVASTVANAMKWFVTYKLISSVSMQIQRGLSAIVSLGTEYFRTMELQQLALRGILAENFKISNQQGTQLTGAAAMTALQGEAVKQWRELQSSSLAVVGTTADLMLLYNSILPYASRLGKNLEDVQKMTKATAVAASLMDISFQDARSAITSMLRGNFLGRNRLVASLGISEKEIKALKGQSALFDLIYKKLDAFSAIADEAQGTFGAMSESFKEFVGLIGAAAVEPFIKTFKDGVVQLQDLLFQKPPAGSFVKELTPRPEVAAFFKYLQATIRSVIQPARDFAKTMMADDQAAFQLVQTVGEFLKVLVMLTTWFAKTTVGVSKFVAANQTMLKVIAYSVAIFAGGSYLKSWGLALAAATKSPTLLGRAVSALISLFPGLTEGLNRSAKSARGAGTAFRFFSGSLAMIGSGLIVGAVVAGLSFITSKLFGMKQAADAASEAMKRISDGDYWGAMASAQEAASAGDFRKSNEIIRTAARAGEADVPKLTAESGVAFSVSNAAKWGRDISNEINKYQKESNAAGKILEKAGLPKAQRDALNAKQEQLAVLIGRRQKAMDDAIAYLSRGEELGSMVGTGAGVRDFSRLSGRKDDSANILGSLVNREGGIGALSGSDRLAAEQLVSDVKSTRARIDEHEVKFGARDSAELSSSMTSRFRSAREQLEAIRNVKLAPIAGPDGGADEKKNVPDIPFLHGYDENLKQLDRYYKIENALVTKNEKARLLTQEGAEDERDKLDIERLEKTKGIYKKLAALFEAFAPTSGWSKEKIEEQRRQMREALDDVDADLQEKGISRDGKNLEKGIKLRETQAQAGLELREKLAEARGEISEKLDLDFEQWLQTKLKEMKGATEQEIAQFIADAEVTRQAIIERRTLDRSISQTTSVLSGLERQQELVDEQFQSGRLGIAAYVEQMEALRRAQSDATSNKIGLLGQKLSNARSVGNVEEVVDLSIEIANLERNMRLLNDRGEALRKTFTAFTDIASRIGAIAEPLGVFGEKFKDISDHIKSAFEQAKNFVGLFGEVRAFIAQFKAFQQMQSTASFGVNAIGGIGAASMFGKNATQAAKAADPALAGASAGGASSTGAILAGIGAAAGIAIGIATSLYAKAVESARKRIQKTMEDLTKSIANGTVTLGEGLARAERERRQTEIQMSKSKSGRKAWKEEKEAFDDMIQDMKDKIQDIRDSFDEQLKTLRLGDGPYADFAKDLMELEMRAKEYLDTFTVGTDAYNQALQNITEMWNLTLANAKRNLESQMMGFEGEALASAQRVIDLIDERKQLQDDLGDVNKQRKDLDEDWAEIAEDEREEWRRFQKEREDYQERILELQKQISESIRQAAQDEADIRRRGVLEAQETVAVKKAREIAKVRSDAADEISDLKKQLSDLTSDPDERIDQDDWNERAKQLLERREALEERRKDLAHREGQIRDSIKLNQIRLTGAKQIAGIEGTIFDISGDRFELESKRMSLEVSQAKVRVQMWRETAALVEAIAKSGDGFIFNVPPGFPQVRIQIGNIIIDNSDNSSTSNNGGGGGGNGPGTPGDPGMKDPRQKPPTRPGYDWYWDHNLNTWVEYKTGKPQDPYPVDPDGKNYTKAGRQGYY